MRRHASKRSSVPSIPTALEALPTLFLVIINIRVPRVLNSRFSAKMDTMWTRHHRDSADKTPAENVKQEPTQYLIQSAVYRVLPATSALVAQIPICLFQESITSELFVPKVLTALRAPTKNSFVHLVGSTLLSVHALKQNASLVPLAHQMLCLALKAALPAVSSPQVMKAHNSADAKARIEFTPQLITLAAASLALTSSPLITSARERLLISLTVFHLYSTVVTKKVRLEVLLANAF